mgnify:CR=1 FL=1
MNSPSTVLLIVFMSGCQLAVNDRVSLDGFDFSTTDPSELFFKNVRQSYYDLEERQDARMNVFRMSTNDRDSLELYVAIIHHWALDKAYLWLEPGAGMPEQFDLTIITEGSGQTISFDGSSPMNHLEVATAIFHGLLEDAEIQFSGQVLLPKGSKKREAFRVVGIVAFGGAVQRIAVEVLRLVNEPNRDVTVGELRLQ